MSDLCGKKFIASYSGGKDSALALHRAIKEGLIPLGLITTYNTEANRSWFHGIPESLMQKVSDSLGMPVNIIKTPADQYEECFENALLCARQRGAEVCVFGDIDIEDHRKWCSLRCERAGLTPWFPLWGEPRKKLVYEFIDAGFSTIITIVDRARMPESFLGQTLCRDVADLIEKNGADICGENGEYHTFTFDGPIFENSVDFSVNEKLKRDNYSILNIE